MNWFLKQNVSLFALRNFHVPNLDRIRSKFFQFENNKGEVMIVFIGKRNTKGREDGTRVQTILNDNISKVLSIDGGSDRYFEKISLLSETNWFKQVDPLNKEGLAYHFNKEDLKKAHREMTSHLRMLEDELDPSQHYQEIKDVDNLTELPVNTASNKRKYTETSPTSSPSNNKRVLSTSTTKVRSSPKNLSVLPTNPSPSSSSSPYSPYSPYYDQQQHLIQQQLVQEQQEQNSQQYEQSQFSSPVCEMASFSDEESDSSIISNTAIATTHVINTTQNKMYNIINNSKSFCTISLSTNSDFEVSHQEMNIEQEQEQNKVSQHQQCHNYFPISTSSTIPINDSSDFVSSPLSSTNSGDEVSDNTTSPPQDGSYFDIFDFLSER